jgi:hypothetical protein
MAVKTKVQDEAALELLVKKRSGTLTLETKKAVGDLEHKYVVFRRYQRMGFLLLTAAFFIPMSVAFTLEIFFVNLTNVWSTTIGIVVLILSIMLCSYYGVRMITSGATVVRQFHAQVDTVLFSAVFTLFGVKGRLIEHTVTVDRVPVADGKGSVWAKTIAILRAHLRSLSESPESQSVIESLKLSQLITVPYNTIHIDNVFALELEDKTVMVSELKVDSVENSGRHKRVVPVFKGYFIVVPLHKPVTGKTFITTEGDTHGFGYQQFWNTLITPESGLRETTLESNDFEKLIHVATTNGRESREILTPTFMQDLSLWWQKQDRPHIRISFIQNVMYMIFPDEQIRFAHTVSKVDEALLAEYMLTIARPLLHVLHVVEDVRR